MVLIRRHPVPCVRACLLASAIALAPTKAAQAQDLERAASVLDLPADEYPATTLRIGPAEVIAAADARVEYDSNIYATPDNEVDDLRLLLIPRLLFSLNRGQVRATGRAEARITRYVDQPRENSTGATLSAAGTWSPTEVDRFLVGAGWERLVEDRGDPEARATPFKGPRRLDAWRGELGYARLGRRTLLDVRGNASRFDYLSGSDDERDQTVFAGSARLGYRISGLISAFGEGFAVHRNFRLATDFSGVDRDATTYGARAGVSIDPGGTFRGDAAIGLFRFNPASPLLESRTGVSAQAGLVYYPSRRFAITLDGFAGDVATVRAGAQSRTDTRLRLGVQQEVRRNLRWQSGLFYRRTNFVGSGTRERTLGGFMEIEYLINRRLAVAGTVRYSARNSTLPSDDFGRFRGGLELRLQY